MWCEDWLRDFKQDIDTAQHHKIEGHVSIMLGCGLESIRDVDDTSTNTKGDVSSDKPISVKLVKYMDYINFGSTPGLEALRPLCGYLHPQTVTNVIFPNYMDCRGWMIKKVQHGKDPILRPELEFRPQTKEDLKVVESMLWFSDRYNLKVRHA